MKQNQPKQSNATHNQKQPFTTIRVQGSVSIKAAKEANI